jgi:FAD/FMN-containing dehydrogenase
MHRVERAMAEIFGCAVALGGAITGENSVGLAKKAFLLRALGSTNFRVMRDFKRVMDPDGILNPGKIFE